MEGRELRSGRRGWRTRIGLDLGARFLAQVMPVKLLARVITAHRVCAFLLAIATTDFCQPERSFKTARAHARRSDLEMGAGLGRRFENCDPAWRQ